MYSGDHHDESRLMIATRSFLLCEADDAQRMVGVPRDVLCLDLELSSLWGTEEVLVGRNDDYHCRHYHVHRGHKS